MMRSPRPVEGRAKNYVYPGPLSDDCLRFRSGSQFIQILTLVFGFE